MRNIIIRTLLLLGFSFIAGVVFITGCGSDVVVVEEEYGIDPPPSDVNSAGVLSGFNYATGGEHYKTVQSLGRTDAESIQTSTNGTYQVK